MRKFIKGLLLSAVSFAPGVAWSESLADALISAYRTSHLLEQNQAVLRAADEDVAAADESDIRLCICCSSSILLPCFGFGGRRRLFNLDSLATGDIDCRFSLPLDELL